MYFNPLVSSFYKNVCACTWRSLGWYKIGSSSQYCSLSTLVETSIKRIYRFWALECKQFWSTSFFPVCYSFLNLSLSLVPIHLSWKNTFIPSQDPPGLSLLLHQLMFNISFMHVCPKSHVSSSNIDIGHTLDVGHMEPWFPSIWKPLKLEYALHSSEIWCA